MAVIRTLVEVGQAKPNAWGLYDMHGNVLEWCGDWYGDNYYLRSPVEDPQGPEKGSTRVKRGGSWGDVAATCRSAFRFRGDPGVRSFYAGFRVVLPYPVARDSELGSPDHPTEDLGDG